MTGHQSKASWLTLVRGATLGRYVPRFELVTAADWLERPSDCLTRIQRQFAGAQLAVRSSKHNESAGVPGQAGHYRSFGPVDAANRAALSRAVKSVFASYGDLHEADEVMLQLWVANSTATIGVTSADATPFSGTAAASYYVGESTSAITAGWTNVQRFWLTANTRPATHWPSAVRRAFLLLAQLESTLKRTALELEIVVDKKGRLRLLQVTPSTRRLSQPSARIASTLQEKRWAQAEREFEKRAQARDGELGRKQLFGLMPDWNTAELLGEHPRPLAASLFADLIANNIWRQARINLGYRRSAVHPLLALVAGRPYVDVRASLNSLIPDGISDAVSRLAIDASINKLRQQPELHDRVETDLFPTCMGFANEGSSQLKDAGLSMSDQRAWRNALLAMEPGWQQFSAHASGFDESAKFVQNAVIRAGSVAASTADLLTALGLIRGSLALSFAMHARLAFVARFQLASLVTAGALSQKRLDHILGCVSVVNSIDGVNARDAGVLRPATFDIRVQPVGNTLINANSTNAKLATPSATFTTQEHRAVTALLKPMKLNVDASVWLGMALRRIELREVGKYRLSLAVSTWLSALTDWGQRRDLSVDDLSFVTVKNITNKHEPDGLHRQLARNRKRFDDEGSIKMPLLVANRADIRANTEPALRPTFLGRARVSGALCAIDRHTGAQQIAAGAVVLIRAADPGFDWIFARPFAALITCYGGPHSHMAIRCAELNIPCVLGCGETVYNALSLATGATIDFDLGHLTVNT